MSLEGSKLSDLIVGGTIGAGLLYLIWSIVGFQAATAFTIYLIYEAYTIINSFPEDTLSESIWRLAARPLVPWLFGAATMYAIMAGHFGPDIRAALLAVGIGFLEGHFFFQSYKSGPTNFDGP